MDAYRSAAGAERMFRSALADQLANYRLLEVGEVRLPEWYRWIGGEALAVHGSTGRRVWVFQRVESEEPERTHGAKFITSSDRSRIAHADLESRSGQGASSGSPGGDPEVQR